MKVSKALLAFACTAAFAGSAAAQDLTLVWKRASGEVVKQETLSKQAVDDLRQSEIKTSTPWTKEANVYRGPSLALLAERGGAPVREARVLALNDYSQTVPAEDWTAQPVVLASRMDEKPMSVRDKGPYWVVYPLDADVELRSQRIHARMVWQVKTLEFTLR